MVDETGILIPGGPVVYDVGPVKIVLRRVTEGDLKEVHRLMGSVPWNTLYQDVADIHSVRSDMQVGAFLLENKETLICKLEHGKNSCSTQM